MSKLDLEMEVRLLQVAVRRELIYCLEIKEEHNSRPWFHDINQFIKVREYPIGANENDQRILRRLVMSFIFTGDVIHKRNYDGVSLR